MADKTDTAVDAEKAKKAAEKNAKWKELVTKRVNKAIDALRTVKALANLNNYSFTAEEAQKVNDALGGAVDSVEDAYKAALEGKKPVAGEGFSL